MKNKIWEDIEQYNHKFKNKGHYTEKEFYQYFLLTHTWLNLCKIEEMNGHYIHTTHSHDNID